MTSKLSSKTAVTSWAAADQMHVLAVGDLDRRMTLEDLFTEVPLSPLIKHSGGLRIDRTAGDDGDVDLLTCLVTGTPKLSWDESEDVFALSKGVTISGVATVNSLVSLGVATLPASVSTTTPLIIGNTTGRAITSDLGGATEPANQASLYICHTNGYGVAIFDKVYDATTDGTGLILRRARGLAATPTDVINGDQIGYIDFRAFSGRPTVGDAGVGAKYFQCTSIAVKIDGTYVSGQAPPSRLTFHTNIANGGSTERMRITAAGFVGIGTLDYTGVEYPTVKLHVYSTGAAACALDITNSSTTAVNGLSINNVNTTVNNQVGILFGGSASANKGAAALIACKIVNRTVETQPYGDIRFGTRAADGFIYNRFVVASAGNVGIAVDAPAAKFHVIQTTEQLRLGYDAANYCSVTVSSTGVTTLNATDGGGATAGFMFGSSAAKKLGFWGHAPVVQPAKASYNNWAAFGDVVNALVACGILDAA